VTRSRRARRGQGLVEFALIFPVFALLLFGLLDLGRAVYDYNLVSQSAREAARTGSVEGAWIGHGCLGPAPICPTTVGAWKSDIIAGANRMAVGIGPLTAANVTLSCGQSGDAVLLPCVSDATDPTCRTVSNTCSSFLVRVTVTWSYSMVTPIIGRIVPPVALAASTTMTID
jgi:hypothetical protein